MRRLAVAARPYCTGPSLLCMHDIVGNIEGPEGVAYVIPRLEMDEDEDGGGDAIKMDWEEEKARLAQSGKRCLPRCSLQNNLVQQSTTK